MSTNAFNSRLAVSLADLVESSGGSPRFVKFSTRLAGEVQKGVRRGDHLVETILLVGFSYSSMIERSRAQLEAASSDPNFALNVCLLMATRGLADEITGDPITIKDVEDAINGTVRGRKGLLTSYTETLAGANHDYSCENVYEPLNVDGTIVEGCKVYVGDGNPEDPKAPVRGTVYINGVTISSKVVQESVNGNKIPSRRGAVAMVKDYLEERLNLPAARFRTYRLLPGEQYDLQCGSVAFHAVLGGVTLKGPGPVQATH